VQPIDKIGNIGYHILIVGIPPRPGGRRTAEEKMRGLNSPETFRTQPETRVEFFIWIGRNPLKSPDSDKLNQGNPSDFAWFYLDLFGQISRSG
jgi:hypothetical protein